MEEKRLIYLAKQGHKNYLEILLIDNYDFVYHYLLKLTLNKSLSEDLCQETMIKAIVHLKKFKEKSKFSTWLISIASNMYRNHYKRNKKLKKITLDQLDILPYEVIDFDKELFQKEMYEKVLAYLKGLKPSQSQPFILKYYYGYDLKTISEIMSCPLGTVKSRIYQTTDRLKLEFKEALNEDFK